jgi:hypothetical protein
LILKGVKVVCFDTLLQVLILNDIEGRPGGGGYASKENLFTTEVTKAQRQKELRRPAAAHSQNAIGWVGLNS